uniref:Uncharacterized protein n=1 Tax=Arundo donax TaxID=35708 RepID=A0A0A9RRU4_ARUDO
MFHSLFYILIYSIHYILDFLFLVVLHSYSLGPLSTLWHLFVLSK